MIEIVSATCSTSPRRWLLTSTVLPSDANRRIVTRIWWIPCGSSPFVGSSRISSSGDLSSVAAIASRCFIPREYDENRSFARSDRSVCSSTWSTCCCRAPIAPASRFRFRRPAERREEPRRLDDRTHPADDPRKLLRNRMPEYLHPPAVGANQPQQHSNRRRLPRAVRSEEPVHATSGHIQVEPLQSHPYVPACAVRLAQPTHHYRRFGAPERCHGTPFCRELPPPGCGTAISTSMSLRCSPTRGTAVEPTAAPPWSAGTTRSARRRAAQVLDLPSEAGLFSSSQDQRG
jgi:hypothetical protein